MVVVDRFSLRRSSISLSELPHCAPEVGVEGNRASGPRDQLSAQAPAMINEIKTFKDEINFLFDIFDADQAHENANYLARTESILR